MNDEKTTSPWVWFGCGCATVIGILVLAFGGVIYFGYRTVKNLEANFTDPQARAAKVEELLQTEEFPPGYQPAFGLSVPFFMDMAILSTEPTEGEADAEEELPLEAPDGDEHFERALEGLGEGALFYLRIPGYLWQNQDGDDWDQFLQSDNIDIDRTEVVASGEVRLDEMDLTFTAYGGQMEGHDDDREGIFSVMLIDCANPKDNRGRFAIWFEADDRDPALMTEEDLVGTPADPDAMAVFMEYLHPCEY